MATAFMRCQAATLRKQVRGKAFIHTKHPLIMNIYAYSISLHLQRRQQTIKGTVFIIKRCSKGKTMTIKVLK